MKKILGNKMIYCFDLDNTICSQTPYNESGIHKAKPFKKRIKIINELYKQGHIIIVETGRGSVTGKDWFAFTKKQLKKWGVKYHKLRTGVKISADFYIDDKGINADEFFLC